MLARPDSDSPILIDAAPVKVKPSAITVKFADGAPVRASLATSSDEHFARKIELLPAYRPEHVLDHASPEEIRLRKTGTTILTGDDVDAKRKEILGYFLATYDVYEKLFEVLADKAFYMRADPLRHPLIFYYGHTAVLYVNKLRVANMIPDRVNPHYEALFAVGVDEMSWDDLLPDSFNWPTVAEVKAYRDQVREIVVNMIKTQPLKLPIQWDNPWWAVLLGIEHERIHLETSTVLIRQLPLSVLKSHPFWSICPFSGLAPRNALLPVIDQPRKVVLGKSYDHPLYGWDNEFGTQESEVPPFRASKYLVTNAEYLGFIEAGGYEQKEFWTEEGWRWVNFRKSKGSHPLFWVPVPASSTQAVANKEPVRINWRFRTMLEEIDMPWDWPAEVNYLEAKAFCNWKAAVSGRRIRLPTEDEFEVLRDEVHGDHPYWNRAPGNINMEYYMSSTPVTAFPETAGGFHDVVGNVWQHTETPIDAFKGFRVHRIYDDFSVPTFDTQHNLIKGGSWSSTGNEAHRLSRYAFRRHFYQHAGFRYVETDRVVTIRTNAYERDDALSMYMDAHFSKDAENWFGVESFTRRIAELAIHQAKKHNVPLKRAADVGCAVGRGSFELARAFEYVIGLDFSVRFNRMGVALKEQGVAKYSIIEEGDILTEQEATLSQFNLDSIKDRVEFFQGDACNLDPRYTNYDLVLASNLIDRLYDPRAFLTLIHERVNPGGLLIIASPNSWELEFTRKELWLGGFKDKQGRPVHTFDTLKQVLLPHFDLVEQPSLMDLVIRETRNKFQHLISEVTVWQRRSA